MRKSDFRAVSMSQQGIHYAIHYERSPANFALSMQTAELYVSFYWVRWNMLIEHEIFWKAILH